MMMMPLFCVAKTYLIIIIAFINVMEKVATSKEIRALRATTCSLPPPLFHFLFLGRVRRRKRKRKRSKAARSPCVGGRREEDDDDQTQKGPPPPYFDA